jgi:RNA polymerase-binding transcription factor DksA
MWAGEPITRIFVRAARPLCRKQLDGWYEEELTMAASTARKDINTEEFRTLLNTYKVQLTSLHNKQRSGTLGETSDSVNESAYSSTDTSENGDTGAILADLEREFPAEANISDTLKMIDAAIDRLNDGSYGIDEVTGELIPVARLRAIPWATMTVETAERVQE